jgi:hypothetical protein
LSSRHLAAVSLALLLSIGASRCSSEESRLDELEAGTVTRKVRIFLIAPRDAGSQGRAVGCGDSVVPTTVTLDRPRPALFGALEALLERKEAHDGPSGLSNPLYASHLELQRIDRQGAVAKIYLSGYVEVADACDAPRLLAQLTETVLQFRDVQHVQLYLDGKPLRGLLLGGGKGEASTGHATP